jgi:hypothetical protein
MDSQAHHRRTKWWRPDGWTKSVTRKLATLQSNQRKEAQLTKTVSEKPWGRTVGTWLAMMRMRLK